MELIDGNKSVYVFIFISSMHWAEMEEILAAQTCITSRGR